MTVPPQTDATDELPRCRWCNGAPEFPAYHDAEWGFPVADDRRLFEKVCLEAFQSGLSWRTILSKREHFRRAFLGFDFDRIAAFGPADVERLLQDEGIVRHRGKIEAAIHNAACALALRAEAGSLAAFVWQFEPTPHTRPKRLTPELASTLAQTAESIALSKALKQRGWKFVGPTTMYAFMQSMGLVNDHLDGCHAREACEADRVAFKRPALKKSSRV